MEKLIPFALIWLVVLGCVYLAGRFALTGTALTNGLNPWAAIVCAGALGPGLAVGHGVLPFPGGILVVFALFQPPYDVNLWVNLACWALSTIFLLAINYATRQDGEAS